MRGVLGLGPPPLNRQSNQCLSRIARARHRLARGAAARYRISADACMLASSAAPGFGHLAAGNPASPHSMTDFDLTLHNGRIVTADADFIGDIGIVDGVITAISPKLPAGKRAIDAAGRLVMPGGIDSHCHVE